MKHALKAVSSVALIPLLIPVPESSAAEPRHRYREPESSYPFQPV